MRRVAVAITCLAAIAWAQSSLTEQDVWNEFTRWLPNQPANSNPAELIESYRAHLGAQGLTATDASNRMGVVSDSIANRRRGVELLWDKVYDGADPIFVQSASAAVVRSLQDRKPGKALDIGMGQGRNALYLAARGWDVTGFDPSTEAVRIALSNAAKAGLKINALAARDDEFNYGSDQWDLIIITYVRDLYAVDSNVFWKALKPGGAVVYENGSTGNNSVLRAFLGYQILWFEDVLTTPDWNPQEKIRVQRLLAQKTLK